MQGPSSEGSGQRSLAGSAGGPSEGRTNGEGEGGAAGAAEACAAELLKLQQQVPVSLAMLGPHLQLQQFLQQPLLTTQQLQTFLQQQQALGLQQLQQLYKQQQQQQEQEQLRLQVLQQQEQASKKLVEPILQLQVLQQHVYNLQQQALAQGLLPHDMWKDTKKGPGEGGTSTHTDDTVVSPPASKNCVQELYGPQDFATTPPVPVSNFGRPSSAPITSTGLNGRPASWKTIPSPVDVEKTHPLFGHGVCKWPGCDALNEDFGQFLRHLNSEHALDDRSTAQCRVQLQVVQQLETQLFKEKERLGAMMKHLMVTSSEKKPAPQPMNIASATIVSRPTSDRQFSSIPLTSQGPITALTPTLTPGLASPLSYPFVPPLASSIASSLATVNTSVSPALSVITASTISSPVNTRRRAEKMHNTLPIDLSQNPDFYQNADIRPPFTYASLIRQAILECPEKQLTLNEIYTWFTQTFAYFRRNAATWKNAVRHNLSLHKCFVRVESVKGAVWTVDEMEYQKRRPPKLSGSPTLMKNLQQSSLGSALNTSLQTSMAESGISLLQTSRDSASHLFHLAEVEYSSEGPQPLPLPDSLSGAPHSHNGESEVERSPNRTERGWGATGLHMWGSNIPGHSVMVKEEPWDPHEDTGFISMDTAESESCEPGRNNNNHNFEHAQPDRRMGSGDLHLA
uniref:forkhead box protein P1-like n=1 Tax=Myxine glutinosa TaxID=7769 RepID=UPI00358E4D40